MKSQEHKSGDVLVVEILDRRLDAKNAVAVKSYFLKKFDEGECSIAVDLNAVSFIDSSGLGAFVTAMKLLGDRGTIVFFGVRPEVADVFRLTRMDRIFTITKSEPDALQAFAD